MATSDAMPPMMMLPHGDRNRGSAIIATQMVLAVMGTVLVILRLYVRRVALGRLGFDDLLICIGLVFFNAVVAIGCITVHNGLGRHEYYLSHEQISKMLIWLYFGMATLILSNMFTRLSICIFLLRIFQSRRAWRWTLYSMVGLVTAVGVILPLITLLWCHPPRKAWNPQIPGKCPDPGTLQVIYIFFGALNAFSDWILAGLPIVFLWKSQIKIKVKVGICVLMGMGFFSGIYTTVRTVLQQKRNVPDLTWTEVDAAIWGNLESGVGIIAACIPTLKPLFDSSRNWPWKKHGRSRKVMGKHVESKDNCLHKGDNDLNILTP